MTKFLLFCYFHNHFYRGLDFYSRDALSGASAHALICYFTITLQLRKPLPSNAPLGAKAFDDYNSG